MLLIDSQGNVFAGDEYSDGIPINPPPSKHYKLKADWSQHIPDVWEPDLAGAKKAKIKKFSEKTKELVDQGFTFDGRVFSMSVNAQAKMMTIRDLIRDDLLDPETLLSDQDDQPYVLTKENGQAFVEAGYARLYRQIVIPENAIKLQVHNATTFEEIEAIEDSRI